MRWLRIKRTARCAKRKWAKNKNVRGVAMFALPGRFVRERAIIFLTQ